MNDQKLANRVSIVVVSVMILLLVLAASGKNYRVGYTTYVATENGMVELFQWSTIVRQFSIPTNQDCYEAALEDAVDRGYTTDSISVDYCIKR